MAVYSGVPAAPPSAVAFSSNKMVGLLSDTIKFYVPLLVHKRSIMSEFYNTSDGCAGNCSGHGECDDQGMCICEVKFDGDSCREPNWWYYIAFATIFYSIGVISFIQLMLCIHSEYCKLKKPSVWKALHVTTQKCIYLVIIVASVIRGVYFTYQVTSTAPDWAPHLHTAYYPVVLTGSSLIVCFWAEVFHLSSHGRQPRFLTKSLLAFLIFNVLAYSLLLAEFVLTQYVGTLLESKALLINIFYGVYAMLMFIVVVFFLFYGVEVYFKVRGAFAEGAAVRGIDSSQLHQSRLGLISQALMLMITIGFLFSEILGQFWKDKVPLLSRNWHDIMFRVVELGVALWFPCVLWNCISPEQLWILNPHKILKKLDLDKVPSSPESELLVDKELKPKLIKSELHSTRERLPECWICYDSERTDAGPLIQPCQCKGDVGIVHHDCLRKWLIESWNKPDNLLCKVCKQQYVLERGQPWLSASFPVQSWLYTVGAVTVMCGSAVGAWIVIQLYEEPVIRITAVGVAALVSYVCLKFLGFSAVTAYQRAKVSAVRILGRRISHATMSSSTSSIASSQQNVSGSPSKHLGPEYIKVNLMSSGFPTLDETRL